MKPVTLLKVTLLHGHFSPFLNFKKWYHIAQSITYTCICLINSWICLIKPEYVWMFGNMRECTYIHLNGSCFTFARCNHLFTWTLGYLCQRLHETRSYSLKEHEVVFLRRQKLFFSALSIWFVFSCRLNIFISKLLPLGVANLDIVPFGNDLGLYRLLF